jgi:hypothetical protein
VGSPAGLVGPYAQLVLYTEDGAVDPNAWIDWCRIVAAVLVASAPVVAGGFWLERRAGGPITKTVPARRVRPGVSVLVPSTPYRFKVERVLRIQREPLGDVVVCLESEDKDGMTIPRWHRWPADEPITMFVRYVEPYDYGGDFGSLMARYGSNGNGQATGTRDSVAVTEELVDGGAGDAGERSSPAAAVSPDGRPPRGRSTESWGPD